MPVSRLTLTDFRSYSSVTLEPDPGFVLLFGDNGAGKTNLLEAVSMLAPGRGLRGAALSQMARRGGSGAWAVAAGLSPSPRRGEGELVRVARNCATNPLSPFFTGRRPG